MVTQASGQLPGRRDSPSHGPGPAARAGHWVYGETQASGQLPGRQDYWLPSLGLICNDSRGRRMCASPRRPSRYRVTEASGQLQGR